MKVVIAPDSFKESLSAAEAAAALAAGVLVACPDAQVDLCPMADGGEGTVAAMAAATGGRIVAADVFDALGAPVRAHFALLGGGDEGHTAVIEMAAASGLALVPPEHRDPTRTTTFGTGQLIMAALDEGAREIIIGIGGSATVDGGCGCAQALGVSFVGCSGRPCVCGLAGGGLSGIDKIHLADRDGRIEEARIRVACDVTNPLTGPNGAARIYGPQKGATREMVENLEAGLVHLAEVIRRELGVDVEKMPGAGAAGGLGAGLVAFAGATLEGGLEMIAETVHLADRLAGADLCITGEGKFDSQSLSGKTAVGVAQIARRAGVPTICIPGQADAEAQCELFVDITPVVGRGVTVAEAIKMARVHLKQRAAEAVRNFLSDQ